MLIIYNAKTSIWSHDQISLMTLHPTNRFQANDVETFIEHHRRSLAQEQPTHIDLYDLSCLSVLLHTVASIIELGECCTEFIEVVTEGVGEKVVHDPNKNLWELEDALGQLQLLS